MKRSIGANTLLYPTPVLVVGSYDSQDRPNIMTAAWGGICCSKPPCVTISLQKIRYSYSNIMERKAYTISIPGRKNVREADYVGIYSGKNEDKFAALGLSPVKGDRVDAPYVGEFPLILECKLLQTLELGLHTQFIGEVLDVKIEESCIGKNGQPDLEKIDPITFAPGVGTYNVLGEAVGMAFSIGKKT